MLWEELVKIALLGTERFTLSPSTLQQLAADGIDTDEETTKIVLQAAAFYGQQRKVGFVLPHFSGRLPPPIASIPVQICSYQSSRHLALILKGDYALALPEFIQYLTAAQKQLPPERLPTLLNDYRHQAEFRIKLLPVLGQRGTWLIRQNPEWAAFLPNMDVDSWSIAGKKDRISLLQYLRQTAPTQAIQLLESTWQEELVKDKIDFLKTLPTGISRTDEAFLNTCLSARRKNIRQEAASLLARIADSALVERMYQRVVACFSFEKGHLSIQLPEELDKSALNDGIRPTLQGYSGGAKASHLGQMIAKIPPSRWETYFKQQASLSFQILMRSSWSTVILQALLKASVHFPDPNWIKILVQYWVKEAGLEVWNHRMMKKFIPQIPTTIFNEVILTYLKHRPNLLEENSAVSRLLRAGEHAWSNEVTLLLVRGLQRWLHTSSAYYWDTAQYRQLLLIGAYRCAPNLYDRLARDWNFASRAARSFQPDVERFLRTLLFRKNMIAELNNN